MNEGGGFSDWPRVGGRVRPSDFYGLGSEEEFKLSVWKALNYIKGDTEWGSYFPYGLLEANADPAVQKFVVLLYEKQQGRCCWKIRLRPWS